MTPHPEVSPERSRYGSEDFFAARWNELVRHIADELRKSRQDPDAVFSHDQAERKLRTQLPVSRASTPMFTTTVAESDVLGADLHALARRFVAMYREKAGIHD